MDTEKCILTVQLFSQLFLDEPPHLLQWYRLPLRQEQRWRLAQILTHILGWLQNPKYVPPFGPGCRGFLQVLAPQGLQFHLVVLACPSSPCDPFYLGLQGFQAYLDLLNVLCLPLYLDLPEDRNYLGINNTAFLFCSNLQNRNAVFTNLHICTHLHSSRVSYDQKCRTIQDMFSWWLLFRSSPCRPWYRDLQLCQECPVKPRSTGSENIANSMCCKSSQVLLCLPACPQGQLDLVGPASQIQMIAPVYDLQ